ncbi:MAG: ATP-binding cassette domain-containing protein [Gammaproteobacteria bacterium]|nr:ATP-binding cassette domain-containing protein [Gammaproteobacteria bacterium]MBU1655276.1 ATP-binding cassette domain-containing protein [Gammaproteobacteria bacterium]MBU1962055.1 ATP-binding cassette domain-containing protein [Gammaproteobacteria bacterium]
MTALRLQALSPPTLFPIDLDVPTGTISTLSGPSGIGKTLLLRAIVDLDPNEGDAALGEQTRNRMPAPQWRRLVGFLPAESHWWRDRVGDHFTGRDGLPLAELGLPAEALDWNISRLSSGERQRLALARLLAGSPQALLLDEPTANLDAANGNRVASLIKNYSRLQGIPVIWVSHDEAQCRRIGDRHWVLGPDGLREQAWN